MADEQFCPKDKTALKKVPIMWGYISGPDKQDEEKYGGVIYGGCCIPNNPPPKWGWLCLQSGWADYPGKIDNGDESD